MADFVLPRGGGFYRFPTTSPSLLALATGSDLDQRRWAFGELSERYRRPLYCCLRAHGVPQKDAKDVLQAYFLDLWEKESLSAYDRKKGPLRGFLMADLDFFRKDASRRDRAAVRCPHTPPKSFSDSEVMEEFEPASPGSSPKEVLDNEYFRGIQRMAFAQELSRLARKGAPKVRAMIQAWLAGPRPEWPDYAALSAASGLTENQVRNHIHGFRKRAREAVQGLLRSEAEDIDASMDDYVRMLATFGILGGEDLNAPQGE